MDRVLARPDDVASALVGVFAACTTDESDQAVLVAVSEAAARCISGAEGATACLGSPAEPLATAASSAAGQQLDAAHVESGEGPGVEAFVTGRVVLADGVTDAQRWPGYAASARARRSVLAVPIIVHGTVAGVLMICRADAGRVLDGELLAAGAGAALAGSRRRAELQDIAANLERALVARQEIDEAKGMVMAHLGCGPDEAFSHLATVSQRRNVKVRDLAADMVRRSAGGAGAGDVRP